MSLPRCESSSRSWIWPVALSKVIFFGIRTHMNLQLVRIGTLWTNRWTNRFTVHGLALTSQSPRYLTHFDNEPWQQRAKW